MMTAHRRQARLPGDPDSRGAAYDAVLDALGYRIRRVILIRLIDGPKRAVEIANGMSVTRPAVSQHLKVLKRAGLIVDWEVGSYRFYAVDSKWVATVHSFLELFWRSASPPKLLVEPSLVRTVPRLGSQANDLRQIGA